MRDNLLDQSWQRAAVMELSSLMAELCQNSFTSADDFCIQMTIAAQMLRSIHGQSQLEQIRLWRQRLSDYSGSDM